MEGFEVFSRNRKLVRNQVFGENWIGGSCQRRRYLLDAPSQQRFSRFCLTNYSLAQAAGICQLPLIPASALAQR